MRSVRIKICGVTRVEDAIAAVDLGADFLGLNFADVSVRKIEIERGREIADAVRNRTSLVGVFVNQPSDLVSEVVSSVGLDLVQFHGDETSEDVAPFGERAVKAIRFSGELAPEALDDFKTVWGFVVEARHDAFYGGAGKSWDYAATRKLPRTKPFLLAGGLSPENVTAAIDASRPWGIDVCSGVESAPGLKDHETMWRLFSVVRDGTV